MTTRYIEIYSYHRDRNRFPNPSSFEARIGKSFSNAIDDVSDQIVLFPNPAKNPPLVFYSDYIFGEDGLKTSFTNLPFMYNSGLGDTILRVDELALGITNTTDSSLTGDSDYPRNSIPPEQIQNYYIGRQIENFNTGETRTIVGYRYDTNDSILQSSQVFEYNIIDAGRVLLFAQNSFISKQLSNIPYYYQGKYLKIQSTGEERLILEYFINESEIPTFVLENAFESAPTVGDTFLIISKNNYTVTIDEAFSTPIPEYPVYRLPLPTITLAPYSHDPINVGYNNSSIVEIRLLTLSGGNLGMAVNSYSAINDISYLTWHYQLNGSWNEVLLASRVGLFDRIDSTIVYGNPTIIYHSQDDGVSGRTIWYIRANDSSGTSWNQSFNLPTTDGVTITSIDPRFPIFLRQMNSGEISVFYSPYTSGGSTVTLHYITLDPNSGGTINGSSGWSAITSLGIDGYYGDVFIDSTGSSRLVHILYQDFTTNDLMYMDSTNEAGTAFGTPVTVNSSLTHNVVYYTPQVVPLYFTDVNTFTINPYYIVLFPEANSTNIYISMLETTTPSFYNETLVVSNGDFVDNLYRGVKYNIINNTQLQVFYNGDGYVYASIGNINFADPEGIALTDQITYSPDQILTLHTAHVDAFDIASSSFAASPNMVFGNENALYSLLPETSSNLYVQYRIREQNPFLSGSDNVLISGSSDTFTLQNSTTASLEGKYIWLYSKNTGAVDNSYSIFNDFRKITEWNSITNTGTVTPSFSSSTTDILATTRTFDNSKIVAFNHGLDNTVFQTSDITFTPVIAPDPGLTGAGQYNWNDVAWSPELSLFVVVGYDTTSPYRNALTSPDGLTWTPLDMGNLSSNVFQTVEWSSELGYFVAMGNLATNSAAYSTDGFNWTFYSQSYKFNDMVWVSELGLFVAVDDFFLTSPDGFTWTDYTIAGNAGNWRNIVWIPETATLVATSWNNDAIAYSTDGVNWSYAASAPSGFYPSGIAYSPTLGLYVIGGYVNRFIVASDLTSGWTEVAGPEDSDFSFTPWEAIIWVPGVNKFVTVADVSHAKGLTSSDGYNWSIITTGPAYFRRLIFAPEISTIVGLSNAYYATNNFEGLLHSFSPSFTPIQNYEWPLYEGSVSDGSNKIYFVPHYIDTSSVVGFQYLNTTTLKLETYRFTDSLNILNPVTSAQFTTPPLGLYAGGALCETGQKIYMAPQYPFQRVLTFPTGNVLAHYDFALSGDLGNDISGNNYDGTVVGTPSQLPTYVFYSNVLDLTGNTSGDFPVDYIQADAHVANFAIRDITVTLNFYFTGNVTSSALFSITDTNTANIVPQIGTDILGLPYTFGDAAVSNVALSGNGKRMVVVTTNRKLYGVYEWNGYEWVLLGDTLGPETNEGSYKSMDMNTAGDRFIVGHSDDDEISMYEWNGTVWNQLGSTISGITNSDFGKSVSMSEDGNFIAVGGTEYEVSVGFKNGYVQVYEWTGGAWVQRGSDLVGAISDRAGRVAISSDGSTIVVGAGGNDSVLVYDWSGAAWVQRGSTIVGSSLLGYSVSISNDGDTIAAATYTLSVAGYVRVWDWSGAAWVQRGSDIATPTHSSWSDDNIQLSGDGNRIVIGSPRAGNGQVSVYEWGGASWDLLTTKTTTRSNARFGNGVSISNDGVVFGLAASNTGTPPLVQVYGAGYDNWTIKITNDTFRFTLHNAGVDVIDLQTDTIELVNKWYRITVTTGDNGAKLFVDGVQVASSTNTSSTDTISTNIDSLVIGGENTGFLGGAFSGYMNDVIVYNSQNVNTVNNSTYLQYIDTSDSTVHDYAFNLSSYYVMQTQTTNDNDWQAVTWNSTENLFVAVASSGTNDRSMYSSDGVTWTTGTTPSPESSWQDITSLNSMYIAVGNSNNFGNKIMISNDSAVTWSNITYPNNDNNWSSVAYDYSGRYVTVANTGTYRVAYSASNNDVEYWASVQSANESIGWNGVVYDSTNSVWYAVGDDGIMNSTLDPPTVWNTITPPAGGNNWNAVAYDNNNDRMVAVGNGVIMYSNTGASKTTWTVVSTSPISDGNWSDIIYDGNNTRFVAVASSGTTRVMYSTADPPTSWTAVADVDLQDSAWQSITYSFNDAIDQYVIVGNTGTNRIGYSATGDITNWTTITTTENNNWKSVAYVTNKYIAVSDNGPSHIAVSEINDPTSWNHIPYPSLNTERVLLTDRYVTDLAFSPTLNRYVAVGSNFFAYSSDLTNWTYNTSFPGTWSRVKWISDLNLFITVNSSHSGQVIVTSPDGITWTGRDASQSTDRAQDLAWNGSLLVVVGGNGKLWRSVDGINYTRATIAGSGDLRLKAIEWSPTVGRFVTVGVHWNTGNEAYSSSDGISWSAVIGDFNGIRGVVWSPEKALFVVAGMRNGNMWYSSDGVSFTKATNVPSDAFPSGILMNNVTWIPQIGLFIAAGYVLSTGTTRISSLISSDGINWYHGNRDNSIISWGKIVNFYPNLYILSEIESEIGGSAGGPVVQLLDLSSFQTQFNDVVGDSDVGVATNSVMVGLSNNAHSGDGIVFSTNITLNDFEIVDYPIDASWSAIDYNDNDTILAVANDGNGTRHMISSPVNITDLGYYWRAVKSNNLFPFSTSWVDVLWDTTQFVVLANQTTLDNYFCYTTTDGFENENKDVASSSAVGETFTSVGYDSGDSVWSFITSTGTILTSTDPLTWWQFTSVTTPSGYQWSGITYDSTNGNLVAVANSSTSEGRRMISSADGLGWTLPSNVKNNNWTDITYNSTDNILVAVASSGTGDRVMINTSIGTTVPGTYWGAVNCNDRIFFGPNRSATDSNWIFIDCETGLPDIYSNTTSYTSKTVESEYIKGIVFISSQERIYMVPHDGKDVYYIDCSSSPTMTLVDNLYSSEFVQGAYTNGVYHPDLNRVYFLPDQQINEQYLHYIDIATNSIKRYANPFLNVNYSNLISFSGAVYSPLHKRIYLSPRYSSEIWWYIDESGNFLNFKPANSELTTYSITNEPIYSSTDERVYYGFSMLGDYLGNVNPNMYYLDTQELSTNSLGYEIICVEENYNSLIPIGNCLENTVACYEVSLVSLSLPNQFLETGFGNRIAFYPYVYVEFTSITNPHSGVNQVFSSNNNVSNKYMFHVPISNVNSPDRAAFVLLKSPMKHLIKFAPNDSFKFSVILPTGEEFRTEESDTAPPFPPNFNLQVTAVFSFKRVNM